MYANLIFKEWPFRTTADENFASIWAGRIETYKQIDRLLQKIQFFPKSGLHILWANFGMGKTHTLYHLRYRCLINKEEPRIIPVYAVMPQRPTGFLELYREIVQGLPYDFLRTQLQKFGKNYQESVALHPMFRRSPGVIKALLSMNPEDIEISTTAMQWLAGQPGLTRRQMNLIGVNYLIKTPENAINTLSALTNLACYDPDLQKANKLLVMIDEYQRIGELKTKIVTENNSSLHTYINEHPTNLHLILSFSFGKKENVDYLLSSELKSRTEPLSINLDNLTKVEAVEFIRDLLNQFRNEKEKSWSYPFTPDAINKTIDSIATKKGLTPRRLMVYFDHILYQCLLDHNPDANGFSYEEIRKYLDNPEFGSMDIDFPV
ncbi:MAG: P-loop NTPase family protein [Anaerolineaceae bacterium]